MCIYCRCAPETELCSLAYDHAQMRELANEIEATVLERRFGKAYALMARLLNLFDAHVAEEERGLFGQLTDAGEAGEEVGRLEAEHRVLRRDLSMAVLEGLRDVRPLLSRLCLHADIEDTDLFPFAHQVLCDERWAGLAGHPHPRT
jgi:Hemerythrin HHE cation binding domain